MKRRYYEFQGSISCSIKDCNSFSNQLKKLLQDYFKPSFDTDIEIKVTEHSGNCDELHVT